MGMYKKRISDKTLLLIVALLTVALVGSGVTVAFLIDSTSSVDNKFIPSIVETSVSEKIDNDNKTDVSIKNDGDIDAFIRAEIIITWKNEAGEVYGDVPEKNQDYTIEYYADNSGWFLKDGFYYWTQAVAPAESTGVLIEKITANDTAPAGYFLNVEIIGSGIQVEGIGTNDTGISEGKDQPVEIAWDVTVKKNDMPPGYGHHADGFNNSGFRKFGHL